MLHAVEEVVIVDKMSCLQLHNVLKTVYILLLKTK